MEGEWMGCGRIAGLTDGYVAELTDGQRQER